MTQAMKHTPLRIERRDRPTDGYRVRHLVNAQGHTLAVLTESKATDELSEHIVLCVNAHDELVTALRKIEEFEDSLSPEGAAAIARAALTKVYS